MPQQVGLTERTVTVVNLLPNTNYTFTVEALNGVSELLPNKRFYTQVNVSTSLPGESRSHSLVKAAVGVVLFKVSQVSGVEKAEE